MANWRWIPPNERGADGKAWVEIDEIPKDPNAGCNGPVYCPETGYFDPVLNRRFETKREKRAYMREHGLMMKGDSRKQTEGNFGKTFYFIPGMSRTNRYYKSR